VLYSVSIVSSNLSRIGVIFNSFVICVFVLYIQPHIVANVHSSSSKVPVVLVGF
jgi:hypothetical protein